VSATRHTFARRKCERDFYPEIAADTASEGQVLCEVFPWVDIGIMSALWIFFAATQFYLYVVVSSYGTSQQRDHEKYDALGSPTEPFASDIPMTNRSDTWYPRPSEDFSNRHSGYSHVRGDSAASVSTVLGDKQQHPVDTLSSGGYNAYDPLIPARGQPFQSAPTTEAQPSHNRTLSYPTSAHTQEPAPTSRYSATYYTGAAGSVDKPIPTRARP